MIINLITITLKILHITILFLLLIDGFIFSQLFSYSASETKNDTSWHISAQKISYDNEKQIYVAEGEVIITGIKKQHEIEIKPNQQIRPERRGEIELKADFVEFSNITREAEASGNVSLISGKDSISCERLKLNLETEKGSIYKGSVFIEENHFYIKGDTIEKVGKETYQADKASVTSCDGENPDWLLTGKDIKVTIDGYGTAKDATLWAGKIPALYSPIVLFPVKTQRQTGLLTPRFSSSDKNGFEIEQPLFFAISRGTDATLYSDYMSKRGVKIGIEYRYVLSNIITDADNPNNGISIDNSFGTFFYDYLSDDKIDGGTSDTSDYSFASTPTRDNHDRYWFRMKNNHTFGDKWNLRLDVDYVSDADYLHEFKEGFTGFDNVSKYFSNTFGSSLDEYDDTTRENSLNINRTWSNSSLNMGAKWFDNVISRHIDKEDTTLQKLPSIEYNSVKCQVGGSPFYYDIDYEYRYFYRQDSSANFYKLNFGESFLVVEPLLTGHRTDIFPRVYMPIKFGAFFIEPSAGVRQSLWYVDSIGSNINANNTNLVSSDNFLDSQKDFISDKNDIVARLNNTDYDNFNHREMFDLNIELSTKLSKVFNSHSSFAEKIKHEVIPSIEYSFTPDVNQDSLPYFDELDYIQEENRLTWSVSNRFTARNRIKTAPSDDNATLYKTKYPKNITTFSNTKSYRDNTNSLGSVNNSLGSNYNYREFAWISLNQSYRIDSNQSNSFIISNRSLDSYDMLQSDFLLNSDNFLQSKPWLLLGDYLKAEKSFKPGKSFSDISAEIEFLPSSFFSINSNFQWSPYDNRFTSNDSGFAIKDSRGDVLEAWYRYEKYQSASLLYGSLLSISRSLAAGSQKELSESDNQLSDLISFESESIFASINTKITDNLNLFFAFEHSLTDNETIESHTGFYLKKPCWSMRFAYSDTIEDKALSFIVNLHGIGEFGKK